MAAQLIKALSISVQAMPGNNFVIYPLPINATPLKLAALLIKIIQLIAKAILG